jgi:hypothetical protein
MGRAAGNRKNKMKRIAYSLLLIFLLSCGTRSTLQENHIRVFFRDSTSQVFDLLFVRETALVVQSGKSNETSLIPFSGIDHVNINVHGRRNGSLLGFFLGSVGTAALGVAILPAGYAILSWLIFVTLPATIAGPIIGTAISSDEAAFNLDKIHDRQELGSYAKYPDYEPPELQTIK